MIASAAVGEKRDLLACVIEKTTDSKPVWILTFFDRLTFVALVRAPKTRPNTISIPGKRRTVRSKRPAKGIVVR